MTIHDNTLQYVQYMTMRAIHDNTYNAIQDNARPYITLHHITLQLITFHYITLHDITYMRAVKCCALLGSITIYL